MAISHHLRRPDSPEILRTHLLRRSRIVAESMSGGDSKEDTRESRHTPLPLRADLHDERLKIGRELGLVDVQYIDPKSPKLIYLISELPTSSIPSHLLVLPRVLKQI